MTPDQTITDGTEPNRQLTAEMSVPGHQLPRQSQAGEAALSITDSKADSQPQRYGSYLPIRRSRKVAYLIADIRFSASEFAKTRCFLNRRYPLDLQTGRGLSDGRGRETTRGGFNHIALEVGGIDEALAFYSRLFEFKLRGKSDSMAFIDLGDQFIALQKGRRQPADDGRHFGLVVDDKEAARKALKAAGVTLLDGPFLDFRDPWGNRVEIVGYDNVQVPGTQRAARHGADAFGQA